MIFLSANNTGEGVACLMIVVFLVWGLFHFSRSGPDDPTPKGGAA